MTFAPTFTTELLTRTVTVEFPTVTDDVLMDTFAPTLTCPFPTSVATVELPTCNAMVLIKLFPPMFRREATVRVFPMVALLVVFVNVNPAEPRKDPESLNWTLVFDPPGGVLPGGPVKAMLTFT